MTEDVWDHLELIISRLNDLESRTMNMASRGTLMSNDDAQGLQQMKVQGLYGEELDRVQRWEQFGITSVAPEGSDALIISINGSRDGAQIVAISNNDSRPKDSPAGSTTVYDQDGSTIVLDNAGNITLTCAGKLSINAEDVEIVSSTLTHNGTDISDMHRHKGVVTGADLTQEPV